MLQLHAKIYNSAARFGCAVCPQLLAMENSWSLQCYTFHDDAWSTLSLPALATLQQHLSIAETRFAFAMP